LTQEARESAKAQIQRAAYLEFRMVHPESEKYVDQRTGELLQGMLPPGYEIKRRTERLPDGRETSEVLLLKKRAERGLNGSYVTRAIVTRGNLGEPEIDFELNSEGAVIFAEVTEENIGQRLGIVLDGEL